MMPKRSSHSPKVTPAGNKKNALPSPKLALPEKTSSKASKMSSEIDEIFGGKKRKMQEKDTEPNSKMPMRVYVSDVNPHEGLRTVKKVHSKKTLKASPSSRQQRKKTADGLTVYSEEELGVGKSGAGGTRLCPFDCDCCF